MSLTTGTIISILARACIKASSATSVPPPVKVVLIGISPATHIVLKVTRVATGGLICHVVAVVVEIALLFQVNAGRRITLETCRRGWGRRWCWKTFKRNGKPLRW